MLSSSLGASVSGLGGLGLTLMCPVTGFATLPAVALPPTFPLVTWLLLDSVQVHGNNSIPSVVVDPCRILRSSHVGIPWVENIVQGLGKLHGLIDI